VKRTIKVGRLGAGGEDDEIRQEKLVIEVTPAITKAAKEAIQDVVQFAANFWGHKSRTTVSLKAVEELAALHGISMIRTFKSGMKETILADAAFGGSKKAYVALARSKTGRLGIKQLKIKEPK